MYLDLQITAFAAGTYLFGRLGRLGGGKIHSLFANLTSPVNKAIHSILVLGMQEEEEEEVVNDMIFFFFDNGIEKFEYISRQQEYFIFFYSDISNFSFS